MSEPLHEPRPALATFYDNPRRLPALALRLLWALGLAAILAQLILAVIVAPLLLFTAFFTAVLLIPVEIARVMHPAIRIDGENITLYPLWGRAHTIRRDHITGNYPHPLIYNDPLVGKRLHGKNYRERRGVVIGVRREAGLGRSYRLIAQIAGVKDAPTAFAISSTTQGDYDALESVLTGADHARVNGS